MKPVQRLGRIGRTAAKHRLVGAALRAEIQAGREEGLTLRELAGASGLSVEGVRRIAPPAEAR